jgi:hypothetical protein
MDINTQPLTQFARFFEATPTVKVRMVRDARLFQSDPKGYMGRAYYGLFRNALGQTHWSGSDLTTTKAKIDDVIAELRFGGKQPAKPEHYQALAEYYLHFWKRRKDTSVFEVPTTEIEIAGLRIRLTGQLGISFGGDDYVLEPYFRTQKPTRLFRQAVQYLTEEARQGVWNSNWHAAIYDVRQELILPDIRLRAQDLRIGLEGAAADFQQQWKSYDVQSARETDETVLEHSNR